MNIRTQKILEEKRKAVLELEKRNTLRQNINLTNEDYKEIAAKHNLTMKQLKLCHNNVLRDGKLDNRITTKAETLDIERRIECHYTHNRQLNAKQAAKIILSWMRYKKSTSRAFCNMHHMPVPQLYNLLKEIEVKGTLLGEKVLDPNNFSKPKVTDAIWLYKYPETTRKSIKKLNYEEGIVIRRIAIVLIQYLTEISQRDFRKKKK